MVECLRLSFFFSHVHRETLAPVTPTSCMEAHLSPGGNFDKQHIISHQSAHRSCPTACCCCFGKKGETLPNRGSQLQTPLPLTCSHSILMRCNCTVVSILLYTENFPTFTFKSLTHCWQVMELHFLKQLLGVPPLAPLVLWRCFHTVCCVFP